MKKVLIFFIISNAFGLSAQVCAPPNFDQIFSVPTNVTTYKMVSYDKETLKKQDEIRSAQSKMYRTGITENTLLNFMENALELKRNKTLVYHYRFIAHDAEAIGLYFNNFSLSPNAKMWVFNSSKTQFVGTLTSTSNSEYFAIKPLLDDTIFIQLQVPANEVKKCNINISEAMYGYRGFKSSFDFGDSDNCNVNANCSEGNNYKNQKKSVVRIQVKTFNEVGWCTGTLMNNTAGNCTPYIFSSDHCNRNNTNIEARTSDYNQWIFYFNYLSANCNTPQNETGLNNETMVGCTRLAVAGTAGDEDSDYLMLKLNDTIPNSFDAYYAGWTIESNNLNDGIALHHPSGDIQKVSTFNSQAKSSSYEGIVPHTHWEVVWAATANGHGITEGGSSGGGIFTSNGLLFGNLTGGSASCQDKTSEDYYGKLSWAWNPINGGNDKRIDKWLDPLDKGYLSLEGTYKPCIASQSNNIVEIDSGPYLVYPNPATNQFTIVSSQASTDNYMRIVNANGKTLIHQMLDDTHENFELSGYSKGFYVLELFMNNELFFEKLIITE